MKTVFYNLSFRGLAVLGRFLILIGIGKFLSVQDLGIYGLFYTSVIISIYIIGFDFYTYNTRELIATKNDKRLHLILDQFIFHAAFYVILLPTLLSIFFMDIVPIKYIYMFYLVLIFMAVHYPSIAKQVGIISSTLILIIDMTWTAG